MKIPFAYYFKYWLKNSIMALATGYVLRWLSAWFIIRIVFPYPNTEIVIDSSLWSSVRIIYPPYINNVTLSSFLFFLFCQILVCRYFWGKRRVRFEYNYKNYLIDNSVKAIIMKTYGLISSLRYSLDSFSNTKFYQEQVCEKLIKNTLLKSNIECLFFLYVKIATLSLKNDAGSQEIKFLLLAIKIKPDDFVANYKLAVFYERKGSADNAIKHYKAAINDPYINKTIFNNFIVAQIDRVSSKGTMTKPPSLN